MFKKKMKESNGKKKKKKSSQDLAYLAYPAKMCRAAQGPCKFAFPINLPVVPPRLGFWQNSQTYATLLTTLINLTNRG